MRQKIWSHGTPLGSLGPLSLKDPDQLFSKYHFLVIWVPNEYPGVVALETQAKNLKSTGAWCDSESTSLTMKGIIVF